MTTINMHPYDVCKYKGKWAVIDTQTNVYYFIGTGKLNCIIKMNELNGEHQATLAKQHLKGN